MSDNLRSQLPVDKRTDEDSSEESGASPIDETTDEPANVGPKTPTAGTASEHAPPPSGESGTIFQISNTFNLYAQLDNIPPNVIVLSSGRIFFAVHHHRLILASFNNFGRHIDPVAAPTSDRPLRCMVDEDPNILNIILHCVYGIPCDNYHPSFECLTASLSVFEKYGLALSRYLARGTPLYNTVLNYALFLPIETYALAASYNLEDLAVTASSYTLHIKLYKIPQDLSDAMGTRYLQRLHRLHACRLVHLKELLEEKIYPHVQRPYCTAKDRQVLSTAYRVAGTQIFFDATPAIARPAIELVMSDLINTVTCPDCKESLTTRVEDVITQWMLFKRTI